jgi:lipopolysaccharide transport system ATP-binding protein
VTNLCDRALWLEKGVVQQEGSAQEVCERYLQVFYEVQQGRSSTTNLIRTKHQGAALPLTDQRLSFINTTPFRNDVQIFRFDAEAASFGKGGAQITHVEFLDKNGSPLGWVVGGEEVTLQVHILAHEPLDAPIVGFFIKDRLGQSLFGDNTYISYRENPVFCAVGGQLRAEFIFQMPVLSVGEYSVCTAVANGTQEQHVQHHWIHDALVFKSVSSSVSTGLIGIPMQHVGLAVSGRPA